MFVSLFKNKEAFLTNNINFVYTFMQYIFIYEICRSITNTSPAHYSNRFKQVAKEIYSKKEPSQIIKILRDFILELKIDLNVLKTELTKPNKFIKNYKIAKYIIMLPERNLNCKLTVEHFIFQKTTDENEKKYIGYLGNLIPVNKDKYKDKHINEKLEMYHNDSIGDFSIEKFLEYNFNEVNYLDKIIERTNNLANNFVKLANACYNEIIKK